MTDKEAASEYWLPWDFVGTYKQSYFSVPVPHSSSKV